MKYSKLIIILVVFLGFILRTINYDSQPPSPNWDEVSHGYNAYSILKTAKDEWGNFLPTIFRAYGDYKLPVYIYTTVPFVYIFGLNTFSIRFVSIIAGSLVPIFIYLILKKIGLKNNIVPFLGLFISTFSPGTIFLSRIALEANLFLLLFCISIYFIFDNKFGLSTFFYGLSLLTYNSSRVLLPFYLLILFFIFLKNKPKTNFIWFRYIPFIIFLTITLIQTLNQSGQARYQWVSLLDSGSINKINELRQIYPRFLINKLTFFVYTFSKNYLSHFNPQFIFLKGGSNYQFSLPNFYIISPLFLFFLLLGIIFSLKNSKQNFFKVLIFWLFIAPIPSSITRDAPHILRSIVFLPIIVILISLGLYFIFNKYNKFLFIFTLFILLLDQFIFWPKYKAYSISYSSSWQYGYQQIVSYIKNNYSNYDQFIITKKYGEPHEFLIYYWPWDPQKYQSDISKDWNYHTNWYWVDSFDKFKFLNDWEIKQLTKNIDSNKKTLLITSPNNYNQDNKLIKSINFLNQTPAFDILEIKP